MVQAPEKPPQKKTTLLGIARDWGVSLLTVQHWQAKGFPIRDERALAETLVGSQTSQRVRARAHEVLKGYHKEPDAGDESVFQAEMKLRRNALEAVEDLERYLAYFRARVELGQKTGNQAMIEDAIRRFMDLSGAMVRVRKELQKMGEDSGNTIAKSEARQIVRAIGSRCAISMGRLKEFIGKAVVGATTVEEAANRVEPVIVRTLFFESFKAAAGVAASCGLPEWVVADLRETVGDHIEDGEREFDAPELP